MEKIIAAVVIVLVLVLVVRMIKVRNRFEVLRRAVTEEKSNIGIYMEKRADSLRDALNIAKTNYRFEVDAISRLTQKEQLNGLLYMGEKYPELGHSPIYSQMVRQAAMLNDDIAASRVLLNSNITAYNNEITAFPAMIVAGLFGYKQETFIDEENGNANKRLKKMDVDFGQF